jgi:hypothetical protein
MPLYGPFHTIAVDVLSGIPRTLSGGTSIVVFTDTFAKWTEAFPVSCHDARTVAKLLVHEIVCRWGAPVRLLSDQGPEFISSVVKHTCRLLGINKIFTTTYHPSTNGQVERFNKTLINLLAPFVNKEKDDWDIYIPYVMFAYRNSIHSSTGYSPYHMMFARDPFLPMDSIYTPDVVPDHESKEWIAALRHRFITTYEHAKKTLDVAQLRQKVQYDRINQRVSPTFKPGDLVL